MALARLGSISMDCDDPRSLAEFWAALLGGAVIYDSDDFVAVQTDRGWISTVRVEGYLAPTWPEAHVPKQMHLDLAVDSLDEAEAVAVRLGATKAKDQPSPERWRILVDPAGHPFCVTTLIPE